MCFFLYVASPLTLSEVRSMLPPGLAADLLPPGEQAALRTLLPDAQTVAREDEAPLRKRYRALGYSRERVLRALELHRRALERRTQPAGHWPRAFAAFVAEHARNAGPTLYYLHFSHDGLLGTPMMAVQRARTAEVRAAPGAWLPEDTPVLVVREAAA